ncbi:MAG TPA: extracellular solute-binding protein [Thermomicrobiales bacterium]|nr:extracellular solute-binding protein [Thermomicrobiales bacterium]
MNHGDAKRAGRPNAFNRRRMLSAGATMLASTAVGCGESARRMAAPASPIPLVAATPGAIPGYTDPEKWEGWTLRVAAARAGVGAAIMAVIAEPFAVATGCTIEAKVTDYAELVRSVEEGDPYADAVVVDPIWARDARNTDYLLPISRSTFSGDAIDLFDVDLWSVPAYAYAMVSAYREEAIPALAAPPGSWAEWWDAKAYRGNRALRKGALGTFEFALLADSVPPESLYPLDFPRAIDSLRRISGRIVDRWWESSVRPISWLARGAVDYASAWSHLLWQVGQDGTPVPWVWDQGLVMADRWVIPDGVLYIELVADFLQYATHPVVQAALARAIGVGPVTSAAFAEIERPLAQTLPTAPENLPLLIHADISWWSKHEAEAAQWFNNWLLGVGSDAFDRGRDA